MITKCSRCNALFETLTMAYNQGLCGYCELDAIDRDWDTRKIEALNRSLQARGFKTRIIKPRDGRRIFLFLAASACFILAGLGFGSSPLGATGPILCCLGMICVLWQATKAVRVRK